MYRRIGYHAITLAMTALAVLSEAGPAWAAPAPTPTERLTTIINNITAWVVGILFGVATLFLTIGGLRRMAANGDPTEIEKSNSAFRNALLGYALAVLAPILLGVVKGWLGG